MPYIITTLHPWADANEPARRARTRTAVATLEEARAAIKRSVNAIGTPDDRFAAHHLPESGGTIGPLPDSTVIEVRRVDWPAITGNLPDSVNRESATAVLAAFNASV